MLSSNFDICYIILNWTIICLFWDSGFFWRLQLSPVRGFERKFWLILHNANSWHCRTVTLVLLQPHSRLLWLGWVSCPTAYWNTADIMYPRYSKFMAILISHYFLLLNREEQVKEQGHHYCTSFSNNASLFSCIWCHSQGMPRFSVIRPYLFVPVFNFQQSDFKV